MFSIRRQLRKISMILVLVLLQNPSLALAHSLEAENAATSPEAVQSTESDIDNTLSDIPPPNTLIAQVSPPIKRLSILKTLTPQAIEMSNILGVTDDIVSIARLKAILNKMPQKDKEDNPIRVEHLQHQVDHLTTEVSKKILKSSLEADYAMSEIAWQKGRDEYILANLESRLDKHILWANRLNAIANAVLWSLSGALNINSFKQPRLSIPTGATGIVAGAVPAGLSLATLQLPVTEKSKHKPRENMLGYIFDEDSHEDFYLPGTVGKFLNAKNPVHYTTISRKEYLRRSWIESKLMPNPKSRNYESWKRMVTGMREESDKMSATVLSNRIMMLNHMRTTIYSMKRGLLELMRAL